MQTPLCGGIEIVSEMPGKIVKTIPFANGTECAYYRK